MRQNHSTPITEAIMEEERCQLPLEDTAKSMKRVKIEFVKNLAEETTKKMRIERIGKLQLKEK